ncbi:MAG: hypothetical protein CM1200mP9_09440 [Gammaproteobacteria bacterium]|nr:MAG: hypothetical protein CM1200mP9_09440 [Gammaproteobacteria bacterium]
MSQPPENIKALDTGVSITRWHENSSPPPFSPAGDTGVRT